MSEGLANDGGTPPESTTGTSVDVNTLQGRITELERETDHQKKLLRDAREPVEVYVKLAKTKSGKEIIERLKTGEELTARQAEQLGRADPEYVTAEVLDQRLEQHADKVAGRVANSVAAQSQANTEVASLHERARKELPGYDNLANTSEWNQEFGLTVDRLNLDPEQDYHLPLPPGETNRYWYAITRTYNGFVGSNPEIGKLKPAPKSPDERRAAIASQQTTSAAPAPEEEVSEEMRAFHEEWGDVGKAGAAAVGKRF